MNRHIKKYTNRISNKLKMNKTFKSPSVYNSIKSKSKKNKRGLWSFLGFKPRNKNSK
jgi:hypothetical protein